MPRPFVSPAPSADRPHLGVSQPSFVRRRPQRLKLLGQAAAALVAIFVGDFRIESLTFAERMSLPEWASLPLTFFFIVGVTNAINLADGLDGLAGGTVLLCAAALTAFGVVANNALVAIAGASLVGALLGPVACAVRGAVLGAVLEAVLGCSATTRR